MEKRICELTEKILNNDSNRELNTALLIKGYRYFSEAQRKIKQGIKENNMALVKDGAKELYLARETIDEALIKIVKPIEGGD